MIRTLSKITAAMALCVVMVSAHAASGSNFADIDHAELVQHIENGSVVLLDVNGSRSYSQGHIPGALDFQAISDSLADHLPDDQSVLVVAYCGSPACGAWQRGANAVAQLGYTNVKHYTGGLSGWVQQGGSLQTPESQSSVGSECPTCSTCGACGSDAVVPQDAAGIAAAVEQ